jgi:tetratricopeptide (TPR) repeat protein
MLHAGAAALPAGRDERGTAAARGARADGVGRGRVGVLAASGARYTGGGGVPILPPMSTRFAARRILTEPRLRRRWLTGAVVGALSFVPLAGTLGYENGLVLSPLAAVLGLAVGVDGVRARRWGAERSREDTSVDESVSGELAAGEAAAVRPGLMRGVVAHGAVELGILGGLALGMLLVALAWQNNCDVRSGVAFFLMGPGLAAVMGWVAGVWGGVLGQRRWAQLGLAGLVPATSTGIGLWRLWADPVVFAYDPFWGYFSGAIYDEAVSIGPTYLSFRAYNVLAAGAALGLWWMLVDPRTLRLVWPASWRAALPAGAPLAIAGGLAAWIGLRGAAMGFTADVESIGEVLSGTRETEHFIIHYNPRSPTARQIDAVAADHELAWHELEKAMGRAPAGKVRSFVFLNATQKRQLMGAGTVQVAAPWRQQIYLDYRGFPHPVLPHELAHVFGKTVGDRVFGVSMDGVVPNVALVEGFATAMAPRASDRLDLHDQATVLERLGKRPPLAEIMGPAFFSRSSRVAYTTAGSFCRWLVDTRGFEPMGALYRSGGDFEAVYGETLQSLEAQWLAFLNAREGVTDDDVRAQAQKYERGSVFQRPCAHRAAILLQDVAHAQARGRWETAVEGWRTLCEIEPDDAQHKVGLAHTLAVAKRWDEALVALDEAMGTPALTVTLQATVLERRADVALAAGELTVAADALERALALPLSDGQRRGLLLKRAAARDAALAPLIVGFYRMFETDDDPVAATAVQTFSAQRVRELPGYRGLGSYLLARQLLNVQLPGPARPLLEEALDAAGEGQGLLGPEFVHEARMLLLEACVQVEAFDQADAMIEVLGAEPTLRNGDRLELEQWRARVAFFRAYFARD